MKDERFFLRDTYYFDSASTADCELAMRRVAYEEWKPTYHTFNPRQHWQNCFYIVEGRGEFVIDKTRKFKALPGNVGMLEPGCCHDVKCDPDAPLKMYVIAFEVKENNPVNDFLGINRCIIDPGNKHILRAFFHQAYELARNSKPFANEICSSLTKSIILTIKSGMAIEKKQNSPSEQLYFKCREYLNNNFIELFTLDDIASGLGVSAAHVCRVFKSYGNISPYQYLVHLKMSYAESLLQTTDKRIHEIARIMGYADQYVFSKTFKRVIGVSPVNYRRREV